MRVDVDLSEAALPGLAHRIEDTQRALARIRYGSVFTIGSARVVLNPDSPLTSANFAATVTGDPGVAEETLAALPFVFAEAGRSQVVLVDTPSSLPELSILAEELGYEGVDEDTVLVLTDPASLMEGEPGRVAVPLPEADEDQVVPLLAEAFEWSSRVRARATTSVGHRLDDPRVGAFAAYDDDALAAVALAFVHGAVGQVTDLAVRPEARGRRLGRAVASAAAADCLRRGAETVFTAAEARGVRERFWSQLGFTPAYDAVTYVQRLG